MASVLPTSRRRLERTAGHGDYPLERCWSSANLLLWQGGAARGSDSHDYLARQQQSNAADCEGNGDFDNVLGLIESTKYRFVN